MGILQSATLWPPPVRWRANLQGKLDDFDATAEAVKERINSEYLAVDARIHFGEVFQDNSIRAVLKKYIILMLLR